jgi:glutamine synthetase adenylyltransferase
LNYESDLDLVYVFNFKNKKNYDPNKVGLLFDNFVKRLELFLSYKAINSSVYDIDTRLRPYGVSGPKVINVNILNDYYNNKAWNWEKLALTGAHLIVGSNKLDKIIEDIKNECLTKINFSILTKEVNEMREKLTLNKTPINFLDLKHRKGGLRDIAFINQLLILLQKNNINKKIDDKEYFAEINEISFISSILFDLKSHTNLKIKQFENFFLKKINKQKILKNEISKFLKHNDIIYQKLFYELKI